MNAASIHRLEKIAIKQAQVCFTDELNFKGLAKRIKEAEQEK